MSLGFGLEVPETRLDGFLDRPLTRAAEESRDKALPGLIRCDHRVAGVPFQVPDVGRLYREGLAGPAQDVWRLDPLESGRDRPRSGLPPKLRSLDQLSAQRGLLDVGVPFRPVVYRGHDIPNGVDVCGYLNVALCVDGSALVGFHEPSPLHSDGLLQRLWDVRPPDSLSELTEPDLRAAGQAGGEGYVDGERLGHRTSLFRLLGGRDELLVREAVDRALDVEVAAGDALARLEADGCGHDEARGRMALLRQPAGQRHREAGGMRRRDQLLGARAALRLLGARRPRHVNPAHDSAAL